ncbi:hypothetical protein [Brevundimonas sp.]|uniref:hypothetical protein n=1 Tax=Brevundimonas sp. TaxID=1871086 RepID=UPI002B6EA102|nr:hypothetical protein [Brevundimonas sp.]HWQ87491.1 hypothetical protein [Brevundimonas sp.]
MTKPPNAKPDLRLVAAEAEIYDLMRAPETTTERVKRLQMEARALAVEQVEALEKVLMQASVMAKEIADGGDAYPVGARELAGRLSSDLPARAETLKAIVSRTIG